MSLPAALNLSVTRLRELASTQRGYLAELRQRQASRPIPPSEHEKRALTGAITMLACLDAELNNMDVCLAAGVMTGQSAPPLRAEDLELRPVNQPRPPQVPTEALLASLHRAGDHTLDADEESEIRNPKVERNAA